MTTNPQLTRPEVQTTFTQIVEMVRYEGCYATAERAREVTLNVLACLGRQLTGDERVELTDRLPFEAAYELSRQIPAHEKLTGWAFVTDLAARTGATHATARWDTGTVFAALARLAGPELLARILDQLPEGYPLLFGRPQLNNAQPA